MTARSPAAVWTLSLIAVACQTQAPGDRSSGPSEASDGSMVVAELYGEPITAAELDERIRDDLFNRETRGRNPGKVYELRARTLGQVIDERVVEIEASRRNVTSEELMKQEIESLGGVGDDEVEAFFLEHRDQMGDAELEEISPEIRAFLESKRSGEILASLRERAEVAILLEPVRFEVAAEGPSRGPAEAEITIIEFSDFQCPYCKRVGPTVEEILERYPDHVRFVFRHLPLASHSRARQAAEASVCADAQDRFWGYHDILFANNRALGDADLQRYAGEVGLDVEQFEACLANPATKTKVDADLAAARSAGISGTPAFLVNGLLVSGAKPIDEFIKVIDAELKR